MTNFEALAAQQQIQSVQQIAAAGGKPRVMEMQQQQQQQAKQGVGGQRPLSILPSSLQGVQGANIRPASSVSTQTVHGVQATVHSQVYTRATNSLFPSQQPSLPLFFSKPRCTFKNVLHKCPDGRISLEK